MPNHQDKVARYQEIANRGLQDKLSPNKKARFDEAVKRGIITMPNQSQPNQTKQPTQSIDLENFSPADFGEDQAQPTTQQAQQPKEEKGVARQAGDLALEAVSGFNRALFGLADFVGPDTINAIADIAGKDPVVGTFTEKFGAPKGSFAGPGLATDIASTAGELVPSAVLTGQALKTAAQRLPVFTMGESAGMGVTRQLGQGTTAQQATGGALAGVGQEVGEEVGGETGGMIGGVVAPLATIPIGSARREAQKLLKKAAPEIDKLKETARGIYNSIDESGIRIPANQFDALADDIAATLRKEGADQDLTPKAVGLIRRLQSEKEAPKTLTEIDTLRKVASAAAQSNDKPEQRLGALAIDKIDEFLDNMPSKIASSDVEAGKAFRSARDLWQRAKKSEVIERAVEDARGQASGFENGLRTQFRALAKKINNNKLRGFTPEEVEAIKKVNEGTTAGNIARFLGKFGVLDGLTSRTLTTAAWTTLGGVAGGAGGAAAVPIIGQLSGALSQRMTANNAKMADAIIRAGKNSNKIASVYMQNTPANQRSAEELAQLFLKNEVPIENINVSKIKPLIADAAILASIAKMNSENNDDQSNP